MENQETKVTQKVSVVIPAYNCSKYVDAGLRACASQSWSKEDLEIIIVDDGSTDNSAEIMKKHPVRYIYQDNSGPAAARNAGWKVASGEIVCFTDSDCVPEEEWVEKIVAKYTSDDIGGVGGSYEIANKESLLAECIHDEIIQKHAATPAETDFLGSFNVSYRKRVLEEVGGFDESFRQASGEDNDLAYRVKKAGYRLIFDKEIKVAHYHQSSLVKYLKEQCRHGYWRMKLYRIHPDRTKGDSYAGLSDFAQPPLAMAVVGALVASVFYKPLLLAAFSFVLLLVALQLPVTLRAVARNRRLSHLYFLPVLFLRAFARGIGMIKGVLRFFLLETLGNGNK